MGRYIHEPEFDVAFGELWAGLQSEFFKCETRAYYNEPGEEFLLSLFRSDQINEFRNALKEDVAAVSSVWGDVQRRNLSL